MVNLEQPVEQTTEQLLEQLNNDVLKMPESTVDELRAKEEVCNRAILTLNERVRFVHHESGNNSQDDNSQEESADSRSRALIASTLTHLHEELARLSAEIAKRNEIS